jgi:hypothetical protein
MEFEDFNLLAQSPDLKGVRQPLANTNWCKSDTMKTIISQAKQVFPFFEKDLSAKVFRSHFKNYRKTVHLLEQFLTRSEVEDFIHDNETLADSLVDYCKFSRESDEESIKSYDETLHELVAFYREFPSPKTSFVDLLAELPFQLFILVAHADENLDNEERIEFQRIIRDPEWCLSECSRAFFNSASYFFSEMLLKFHRDKYKKDINQVDRTVYFVNKLFGEHEAGLIKVDLSRLANEIAKASGGIGGFMSISKAEKKMISRLVEIFGDLSEVQTSRRTNKITN